MNDSTGGVDGRRRAYMVQTQIADRGICDEAVLAALREVPRPRFVPAEHRASAYEDTPLAIEAEQTISQPYIVARMLALACVKSGDRVLEVGAGSGYATAVLSRIVARVVAIERHRSLVQSARRRLVRLGYGNVEMHCADGTLGWPPDAPFDAIIVSAAGPKVPQPLLEQLVVGGRLVMPVADAYLEQHLIRVTRRSQTDYEQEPFDAVSFVPLIGVQGWASDHPAAG